MIWSYDIQANNILYTIQNMCVFVGQVLKYSFITFGSLSHRGLNLKEQLLNVDHHPPTHPSNVFKRPNYDLTFFDVTLVLLMMSFLMSFDVRRPQIMPLYSLYTSFICIRISRLRILEDWKYAKNIRGSFTFFVKKRSLHSFVFVSNYPRKNELVCTNPTPPWYSKGLFRMSDFR